MHIEWNQHIWACIDWYCMLNRTKSTLVAFWISGVFGLADSRLGRSYCNCNNVKATTVHTCGHNLAFTLYISYEATTNFCHIFPVAYSYPLTDEVLSIVKLRMQNL